MTRKGVILAIASFVAGVSCLETGLAADKASSGDTQVVAVAGAREITLSELRLEMARIGVAPNDPTAERVAMESLLNRTLLAAAARKASLHRKPEAMARMYAAQDQALAELYLATASQPPEPTREEIDRFIREYPTLFARRRTYDFVVMTLPTKYFDEPALTPLFDEEPDFSRLSSVLTNAGATFETSLLTQSGAAFPPQIRDQLDRYGARDNIVLKGEDDTRILKIMNVRETPVDLAAAGPVARQMLLEEGAAARARALAERLQREAGVKYFRKTAAPASAPQEARSK